jgi:hypothetical protein
VGKGDGRQIDRECPAIDHDNSAVGGGRRGDLPMITGPVGVRFGERLLPRLETGEVAGYDMPTPARVRQWFDLAPMIGDDLFVKLYTHGAPERNLEPLLGGGLGNLFGWLAEEAERRGIELHWATAWQMYQAADALTRPAAEARS